MGFYAELTLEEAIAFVSKKEVQLKEKAQVLTDKAGEIKTHIKVVLQSIADLLDITPAARPRRQML